MILQRKSHLIILWMIIMVGVSTFGFYAIGGEEWTLLDSLFMTLITLATVGFQEVHPLSEAGRIWTIIIILFGVTSFAYLVSQFGSELLQFNQYRRNKMLRRTKKLKDHFIICGYGRMGAVIAQELHDEKKPFVVIENNPERIQNIAEKGFVHIGGDATLENTLIEAGIERARGIVVVLNTDPDNLFVSMSVRTLNSDVFLVSRCSVKDTHSKLQRAGVDKIVNPYVTGGHKMFELLLRPQLEDSVTLKTPQQQSVEFGIDEIHLSDLEKYDGLMIKDCNINNDYGLLIVGIIEPDGKVIVNPKSDVVLNKNQTIMVIGTKEGLDDLLKSM